MRWMMAKDIKQVLNFKIIYCNENIFCTIKFTLKLYTCYHTKYFYYKGLSGLLFGFVSPLIVRCNADYLPGCTFIYFVQKL